MNQHCLSTPKIANNENKKQRTRKKTRKKSLSLSFFDFIICKYNPSYGIATTDDDDDGSKTPKQNKSDMYAFFAIHRRALSAKVMFHPHNKLNNIYSGFGAMNDVCHNEKLF